MRQNISAAAANACATSRCPDGKFDTPSRSEAEINLDAYGQEHQPAVKAVQAITAVVRFGHDRPDHHQ